MDIPNLDNLIAAIQCDGWLKHKCEHCPYNYQIWDTSGDNYFWWCDEERIKEESLFYLKLYQHLINNNKK